MELRAENLHFSYGQTKVLRGVDLSVQSGEVVAIIGPNGSGKSTLLRLLLGLLAPTEGRVRLSGHDLAELARIDVAKQLSFIPQNPPTQSGFTVQEVVETGRSPYLGRFSPLSDADHNVVNSALRDAELWDLRARPVDSLSGGERQRVHLARALAQDTPCLLLDEPNNNLDLAHGFQILDTAKQRAKNGGAIVAALHDLNLVTYACDRVVVLSQGTVVADGATQDVLTPELLADVFAVNAHTTHDPFLLRINGPRT